MTCNIQGTRISCNSLHTTAPASGILPKELSPVVINTAGVKEKCKSSALSLGFHSNSLLLARPQVAKDIRNFS